MRLLRRTSLLWRDGATQLRLLVWWKTNCRLYMSMKLPLTLGSDQQKFGSLQMKQWRFLSILKELASAHCMALSVGVWASQCSKSADQRTKRTLYSSSRKSVRRFKAKSKLSKSRTSFTTITQLIVQLSLLNTSLRTLFHFKCLATAASSTQSSGCGLNSNCASRKCWFNGLSRSKIRTSLML